MILISIVMKPRDPKVTAWQAAQGAALPFAALILVISLGYAVLTTLVDKQKLIDQKDKP